MAHHVVWLFLAVMIEVVVVSFSWLGLTIRDCVWSGSYGFFLHTKKFFAVSFFWLVRRAAPAP
jgi:hypothetical protein